MLKLDELKVQSFVTVLDSEYAKNIKGGLVTVTIIGSIYTAEKGCEQ
jgi:hypothetical protein